VLSARVRLASGPAGHGYCPSLYARTSDLQMEEEH
jgi:hypothetical protein